MSPAALSTIVAYADRGESSDANLRFVMVCLAIIVVVGALAIVPVVLARRRGHRRRETVGGFCVLWALVLAGSLFVSETGRAKWTREQMLRIQSGYYDPQDQGDAPRQPWALWAVMGAGYAALIAWAIAGTADAR